MFLFGTDDFFAFCTASYSVGLPSRSTPPMRAATSMFLISFAKSLPRLASITAFLCFVVAHLEWPDICLSPSRNPSRYERQRSYKDSAARLARTMSTNRECTRWSPVSSGWNDVASALPWRTATM
ncbi:hypothetical protein SALBM311S_08376 [Streptomyces alboniger]